MDAKSKTNNFLKKYGMHYESIDMEQECRTFAEEMQRGLAGEESSLDMIPTYIEAGDQIPTGEPVIAIDAGGTNFRVALITFDRDKKPVIEDFQLFSMPGTKGEISSEEFFDITAGYIKPLLIKSNKIGFCISYPTEIQPNKDGKLTRFSKEVQVRGMEGRLIGAELLNAIKNFDGGSGKSIVLLNDTVAILLAGKAAFPERVFDSYIGFILGTGTNTCYPEKTRNIRKLSSVAEAGEYMLINIESSAYAKAPGGIIDTEFDNTLKNPGKCKFEKMISGGYLGGLILTLIRKAAEEGLFSSGFTGRIKKVRNLDSADVDMFLYYPYSMGNLLAACCGIIDNDTAHNDHIILYYLIDAIIERAAKLVAINLSAIMEKTGKGRNPCAPVCISADGSTFYKSKLFRDKLNYYVKSFINEQKGQYCEFVKVDNGTLTGTAIAGLMR